MTSGFCVWLTGLSGAGKSTIAAALERILVRREVKVTMLDSEELRKTLCADLGFDRADREASNRRIAHVARGVAEAGGAAVVSAISPYEAARADARVIIGARRFVLVFVDTPLAICEERDVKGHYARARRGAIRGFTGIDAVYERPTSPDIQIGTVGTTPTECAFAIESLLVERGLLSASSRID